MAAQASVFITAAAQSMQMADNLINGFFLRQQAELSERQGALQARYYELLADDVRRRGDTQAKKLQEEGRKFLGAQKASIVAQGIALDSDVATQLRHEAEDLISEDVERIRDNVWAQSFGLESEAMAARGRGQLVAHQQRLLSTQSLVTGGLHGARAIHTITQDRRRSGGAYA